MVSCENETVKLALLSVSVFYVTVIEDFQNELYVPIAHHNRNEDTVHAKR